MISTMKDLPFTESFFHQCHTEERRYDNVLESYDEQHDKLLNNQQSQSFAIRLFNDWNVAIKSSPGRIN